MAYKPKSWKISYKRIYVFQKVYHKLVVLVPVSLWKKDIKHFKQRQMKLHQTDVNHQVPETKRLFFFKKKLNVEDNMMSSVTQRQLSPNPLAAY